MKYRLTKKDICCLIISFNPDDILKRLVYIMRDQVDKVIIVDNNSEGVSSELLQDISEDEKVCLIRNFKNYGIAKALNQGVQMAIIKQFKAVITFDQDSLPCNNIIEIMTEVYDSYPAKDQIGAIGINYCNENLKSRFTTNHKLFKKKDYLITSGCLLFTDAFLITGGFREDFFIDDVDLEYSLRLRQYGKVCLITSKIGMKHKPGNPKKRKIFGLTLISSNHNSMRRYYMARNHSILTREYLFIFPYFIAKMNFFFILSVLKILLIDDDKKAKFSAILKGLNNGFHYSSELKERLD
jgi:rhamnosyltransferase